MMKFIKKFYLAIIFVFLYAPMITLVVFSFNNTKSRARWGGFTFKWYVGLFSDDKIIQALINTLTIALISSVIATIIGTIAALAMNNMKKITKRDI